MFSQRPSLVNVVETFATFSRNTERLECAVSNRSTTEGDMGPEDPKQQARADLGRLLGDAYKDALIKAFGPPLLAAASENACDTANAEALKAIVERQLPGVIENAVTLAIEKTLFNAVGLDIEVEQILSDFAWKGLPACDCNAEVFVIDVIAPNRPGLLARVLQVLAANHVGVRTARGATWRRASAWLSIEIDALIEQPEWHSLWQGLTRVSDGRVTLSGKTRVAAASETLATSIRSTSSSPCVTARNERGAVQTTLTILAIDRLGLLAAVAGVIVGLGYDFVAVEAETRGDEVRDVFDIIDASGRPLTESAVHALQEAVLLALAPAV
jgi:predicted amino acid-binding ACT domain protein